MSQVAGLLTGGINMTRLPRYKPDNYTLMGSNDQNVFIATSTYYSFYIPKNTRSDIKKKIQNIGSIGSIESIDIITGVMYICCNVQCS